MSNARTAEIRQIARELLAGGKVELFIGFQEGTVPLRSRPAFVRAAGAGGAADPATGADALVWDSFCANNLANYLPKYYENQPGRRQKRDKPYPRIAIAAKGCDMRSIVALTKERQVQRDSLVVVGVPCQGMIDTGKVEAAVAARLSPSDGCAPAVPPAGEILGHEETETGVLQVRTRKLGVLEFQREEVLQQCCLECRFPMPEGADIMVRGDARKPGDGGYARVQQYMAKSAEERWQYFSGELSRCIRCNACRQACPTCWCKECFAEQTDLKWIGVGNDPTDAMIFQIIRVFHQAGRCVECDACYRACPMNIDLRLYTKKIVKDVEEIFGYLPAFDTEALPPLATFGDEACDFFITDPEKAETAPGASG